jgi:hypothetical protein
MRRSIETAPRDGEFVIIVDDASGRFDVAQWLAASQGWVRADGKPSEVRPSYWNPISNEKNDSLAKQEPSNGSPGGHPPLRSLAPVVPPQPVTQAFVAPFSVLTAAPVVGPRDEAEAVTAPQKTKRSGRRKFATSIAVGLAAVAIVGLYRHNEVAAFLTRYPNFQNAIKEKIQLASQELRKFGLLAPQPEAQPNRTNAAAAAQLQQDPKALQTLKNDERLESLTNELAEARRTMDATNLQLRAEVAKARSLEQERDQAVALVPQAAATQQQLAATAEGSRSALVAEQARVAALTDELATTRRGLVSKAAEVSKVADDVKRLKQTAEGAAELRQSLQQERDKAAALARDLNTVQRELEARIGSDGLTSSPVIQIKPAKDPAVVEPLEVQGSPEATKLIARASTLLTQGNIGAARIVLERAVEAGSARASFALAETYDPNILASWGTYGTRGDASKARELYAKATAGGIREAKDRINALH